MEADRIRFQRDFYQLLLNLHPDNLTTSLNEALTLICRASGADRAYLEIRDGDGSVVFDSISIPDNEIDDLQQTISVGIVAEAMNSREILAIPSAMIDPRFNTRESVQQLEIEAVLCVPFFGGSASGVLYLQGESGETLDESLRLDAELFAAHVSPLLDSFLVEWHRQQTTRLDPPLDFDLGAIVCASETMRSVIREAAIVAPLDVPTLILGETGTGKTQLARTIHDNSPRAREPFVELNCAAIPKELLESELFGALKGAHGTAFKDMGGKIGIAESGTLFLDEIGELPLEVQPKLLQYLESGYYYPLGSTEKIQSNVRVIGATNQNIYEKVKQKHFREDLLFRINTFEIFLPGLEARREDIPHLLQRFVSNTSQKHGLSPLEIDPELSPFLARVQFRGHIRELLNRVERACILANAAEDSTLRRTHFKELHKAPQMTEQGFHSMTHTFQRNLLLTTLQANDWNVSKTSQQLNLSRSHAHKLIKQFNLSRNETHQTG